MRTRILATLLGATLTACVAGSPSSDPFASRLEGPRTPTFAMDTTWLRLGGAPPPAEAGPQAHADWLAHHPRFQALDATKRAELLHDAPLFTARRALHSLGVAPHAIVDPLSLTAATSPTWTIAESAPVDTTAAVIVLGASPNATNDRVVIETASSSGNFIGIVSDMYGGSPTVTNSASIGSRIDGSALITNLSGSVVYAVTSAGVVYAINVADASTAWSTSLGAAVSKSTPWLEFGGTAYLFVADLGGKVTAINPSTGAVVWATNVTGGVPIHSSPVVINNIVWVGADNGQLYRVDATTGAVIGQPTNLCLSGSCTADDAIYSAISGDLIDNRVLLGVNRRIIEIDSGTNGCTASTTTACGYTAYPIQEGSFVAPAGRFEGAIAIDFDTNRVYFGYANRLWRASYNAGITSAFARAATDDPTGLLRGWNPTSHGFPRGIPFPFNNTVFVGDGGGVLHRFDTTSWSESAWKSFNGGTFPGKTGPTIDSTVLIDFVGSNAYFGVARPTTGEWNSLPQSFTSDAATTNPAARFRVATTGFSGTGGAINVTVTALDATGARASGYTGTVRFASSDAAAALPTNYTFTAGEQGQSTFSVTLNTTGSQLITVVDAGDANVSGATSVCVGSGPCGPVVNTDKSSYGSGERTVVSFGFMSGSTYDFIAISPVGAPASQYSTYQYTNGSLDGTVSFVLAAGSYEARAYQNGSYVSSNFTVGAGSTTLTTNASSYTSGAAVIVNWSNAPGMAGDWVAISPDGATADTYVTYAYTGGTTSGSQTFNVLLSPGSYRARYYFNNTYTVIAESAVFTVSAATTSITTSASSYASGTPITVTWANGAGLAGDFVAIATDGAPANSHGPYAYISGAANGSYTFSTILQPGTYRARLYYNNTFTIQAESTAFTVTSSATTITTNASSYSSGAPVTVTWANGAGRSGDFIAIAPDGAPNNSHGPYAYINGAVGGSYTFNVTLSPGTYRARLYLNNTYTIQAESAAFTVSASTTTISADKGTYVAGEGIIASWVNGAGASGDWVAIAVDGAPATSHLAYSYIGATSTGSYTFFSYLAPGTYRVRLYLNNTYTIQAESAAFTVSARTVSVTTDALQYNSGAPITISWSNGAGAPNDYLAISPDGSSSTTYVTYSYISGAAGSQAFFATLSPGTYRARLYYNNTYSIQGESVAFTVVP